MLFATRSMKLLIAPNGLTARQFGSFWRQVAVASPSFSDRISQSGFFRHKSEGGAKERVEAISHGEKSISDTVARMTDQSQLPQDENTTKSSDPNDELNNLRNENANLKHENSSLKSKLAESEDKHTLLLCAHLLEESLEKYGLSIDEMSKNPSLCKGDRRRLVEFLEKRDRIIHPTDFSHQDWENVQKNHTVIHIICDKYFIICDAGAVP